MSVHLFFPAKVQIQLFSRLPSSENEILPASESCEWAERSYSPTNAWGREILEMKNKHFRYFHADTPAERSFGASVVPQTCDCKAAQAHTGFHLSVFALYCKTSFENLYGM